MKRVVPKIFLIFIGIGLALYGTMMPLLSVIGESTQGMIKVIRREGGERNEAVPNRYCYAVGYEFLLDDGTVISGNIKVIGNAYNAGISRGRASIRYLKIFPYLNAFAFKLNFDPKYTRQGETIILNQSGSGRLVRGMI